MNYSEFLQQHSKSSQNVSEPTLRLWHHIYEWVLKSEYADTADSPDFVKYVQSFRNVSVQTISSHLRKMSQSGLLSRHVLRRKLPAELKEEFFNPVINMFFGGDDLPSTFVRYCKPGLPCPREFKSAERVLSKIENKSSEFRSQISIFKCGSDAA